MECLQWCQQRLCSWPTLSQSFQSWAGCRPVGLAPSAGGRSNWSCGFSRGVLLPLLRETEKKRGEETNTKNKFTYSVCVFNWLTKFRVRMPLHSSVNSFPRARFQLCLPKPAFTHQNTTPPQVSPCAAPLMNIDPFMFSLGTTQTKRQWKEKKEKYAKLCSRRSHTCTSLSLDTKLFSP